MRRRAWRFSRHRRHAFPFSTRQLPQPLRLVHMLVICHSTSSVTYSFSPTDRTSYPVPVLRSSPRGSLRLSTGLIMMRAFSLSRPLSQYLAQSSRPVRTAQHERLAPQACEAGRSSFANVEHLRMIGIIEQFALSPGCLFGIDAKRNDMAFLFRWFITTIKAGFSVWRSFGPE